MPQAAFADSTTAPSNHLDLTALNDELEDIHGMLETLAESACLAIENGNVAKDFDGGLWLLFSSVFKRLEHARSNLFDVSRMMRSSKQLLQTPIEPEIWSRVFHIVINVMQDAHPDLPDADEFTNWPEDAKKAAFRLSSQLYGEMGEKLGPSPNLIDAATLLPWVEVRARKEARTAFDGGTAAPVSSEPRQKPRPSLMRDQFIAQCHAEGASVGDISQALGLASSAVERTIRRLTREAAPETAEHDEASAG